jgi:hypothetical protein
MPEMKNLPRLTNPSIDLQGTEFIYIGEVQVSPLFTLSPTLSFGSEAVSHETWTPPLSGHEQRLGTTDSYSSDANDVFWTTVTPNSDTTPNPVEDDGEPKKRCIPFRN